MKALTLYQPWASLVAIGAKTIETRSWKTDYRGPLLIHAAKRWDKDLQSEHLKAHDILSVMGWPYPEAERLYDAGPLGAFVAACILADCREMHEAPDDLNRRFGFFGPGRYGWILEDIRALAVPVPFNGAQGLWLVPRDMQEYVAMHLDARFDAMAP